MAKKNVHIGSSFDDFLAEDGRLEEATAIAIKRVITWQFEQAMKASGITKTAMAERMNTSRASLGRLLDENDTGLTLETLSRGAQALGYRVKVELVAE
ncbi:MULTISPECIES: helix-turn-helix domain-containing protein [Rhodanobacter]|uniref:helix-turn-helix domain-containing protein n=1 Tax=Rhodanobacter TaxID=75309 RepID=UPI00041C043E|nr:MULTISPECIES: helix-turn-helix transcriptional regulator [Rhodanobacter]TAN19391.1 MAG: Fis family transcriptional regulator [Rhodanobacter sp.]UJJ56279.1 helix-turn-helix domain-containing protein [Rhodanobacter thiooxydans]